MERLIAGFSRFRTQLFEEHRARFERIADRGQRPPYAVITCADSRIEPARLFDTVPGEIFLIRNIANLVPPYQPDSRHHATSAAIEFAVRFLKVSNFVVLGHSGCGGISALLDPPKQPTDFLGTWMDIARSAREKVDLEPTLTPVERQRRCELESLKCSLANLHGYPWLAERVVDGTLDVDALYIDLVPGELRLYDPKTDTFNNV